MKNNNFYKLIFIFIANLICLNIVYAEQFNFDVTEIEILNKGNLYKGLKRGTITTNDGIIIEANTFVYNKITNIVDAEGNVKVEDVINNYVLFSDAATYKKNEEIVITEGNSKGIDDKNRTITSDKLTYNKITNIVDAEGNVKVEDVINNYVLFSDAATYKKNEEIVITEGNSKGIDDKNRTITSDKLTYNKITNIVDAEGNVKVEDLAKDYILEAEKLIYLKNEEKILTEGFTEANIQSKYNIKSKNVSFLLDVKELFSKSKSTIKDGNNQIYYLDEFIFFVNNSLLKGKNILTITNYNLPKSDKYFFKDGIFNLKNKTFTAKDTKINIHKDIFNDDRNDPRVYGASSKGNEDSTIIKKGVFTICQKRDGCPPWSIQSPEIKHDRVKKQIEYKNAILKVYDIPVFYFPKFFHPDPTVERQSGFLFPQNNNSDVLGSSITQPYFKVIADNKDYTITPTLFDNKITSIQNEYRQENKNSSFIVDFGFVNGYKNDNRSHIFANYNLDLNLNNFTTSKLFFGLEQVSNDTYLRVFGPYMSNAVSKFENAFSMNNQIELSLSNEDYNFTSGINIYENLNGSKNSDKYQYVLPHYSFDTVLENKVFSGSIGLSSSGSNNLNNTNNLTSNITNNLSYKSASYISNSGLKSNYNLFFKNHNSVGKKSDTQSSPEIDFVGLFEANTSLPLIKSKTKYKNYLTPKVSFKVNPTGMKDKSTLSRTIDVGNVFSTNRLGIGSTSEAGRSLTLGLDFKIEKEDMEEDLEDVNKFFEVKLATVFRDKEEEFIPSKSTLHQKTSNIFGSITNELYDNVKIGYKFSLDNDLNTFEYNQLNTTFLFNNFKTSFNFLEENGKRGESNVLESSFSYNFDENNNLTFKTRRNRKINLTEYYDLVYEYKIDCLTAGIKYKKSYYSDRDIKPNENLIFTITLFPLTTYEHNAEDLVN